MAVKKHRPSPGLSRLLVDFFQKTVLPSLSICSSGIVIIIFPKTVSNIPVLVFTTLTLHHIKSLVFLLLVKDNMAKFLLSLIKREKNMDTIRADNAKIKELFKEAIIEAIEEKKDVVHDLLVEAMEDLAMIRAIQEGEDDESASRQEVFDILEGKV